MSCGGKPFNLSRRELRSLLYYLACQTRPVARAELMALFWGDKSEKAARLGLRVALSRLKAELPNPGMLVSLQEQVSLAQDEYYCDVRGFEIACQETARICAQIPASVPLPNAVSQRMIAALDLWRGPRFLTGVDLGASAGLDDWLAETSEHLQICRQRILARLSQHAEASGDLEGAQDWLRKTLALDPTNDLLNLALLSLLERQGRAAEALAHLQQARSAYARDGYAGLPESMEEAQRRLQVSQKQSAPERSHGIKNSLRLPLIGRKLALEAFHKAYQRKVPVLVTGETGVGKSRLAREFYTSLSPAPRLYYSSARALTLRSAGEIPFLSLLEILRGQVSAEEWRAVPPVWAAVMAQLLPEIEIFVPGVKRVAQSGWGQANIFEALRQTFLVLSARSPLLVVIDDAHLCDESSLLALIYLLRHGFLSARARLVLCAQVEDPPVAFRQFLQSLEQDYALETIELELFNAHEVAEMVCRVFDRDASPAVIEQLRSESGGNPLYLLESLRARLELSDGLDSLPAIQPIRGNVHLLVRERLQKLSPAALQLLTLAAVCDKSVPFWLLQRASHLALELIVECLDELQRANLLEAEETPGVEQRYAFVHEMLRDVLLIQLTPARKRLLSVRIAEAIQEHAPNSRESQAAVIAQLYEQAGDEQTALDYWLIALDYAARIVSQNEALAACRRAENLLKRIEDQVDDSKLLHLYNTWIELEFTRGHAHEIRQVSASLLAQGSLRQNRDLTVSAYLGFAAAADLAENVSEGLEMLEQARPYLHPDFASNPREWMFYHYRRGGFLIFQDHYSQAIVELRQALHLADPAAFVEPPAWLYPARANCAYRLMMALLYHGDLAASIAVAEAAIDESRAAMNHLATAREFGLLSTANFYRGAYALAREQGQISLSMLETFQPARAIATLRATLGRVALATGKVDQAWTHAEAVLLAGRAGGFNRVIAQALRLQGDVYFMFGDYAAALELYQKSIAAGPVTFFTHEAQIRMGNLLILSGKSPAGLELFEQARQASYLDEMQLLSVQLDCGRILALLEQNQPRQALALIADLSARASAAGFSQEYLTLEELAAKALLQEGKLEQAAQRSLAAAALAKEMNHTFAELAMLALLPSVPPPGGAAAQRLRVVELLDMIDANTQLAHLRAAFTRFSASFANL